MKNQKGQMAIFMVLIFQVLFILFAFSLNVAMVVHDKINLQNSLDLAVYYGATKQAEVLNVMAHINYQMRQNWKLLAWRYRILGTMLQYNGHYNPKPYQRPFTAPYWCPQNKAQSLKCSRDSFQPSCQDIYKGGIYPGYCDARYFVCINHQLWRRGIENTKDQNLCTKVGVKVAPVTKLKIAPGAGWCVECQQAKVTVDTLRKEISFSCPLEGALNWLMTQLFLTHFRFDQKDRKAMITEIYNKTFRALENKDSKDIDGKSILQGAKKVFINNLSKANHKSFDKAGGLRDGQEILQNLEVFKQLDFEEAFGKLNVAPRLQFIHVKEVNDGDCNQALRFHDQPEPYKFYEKIKDKQPELAKMIQDMKILENFEYNKFLELQHDNPALELTLSFFKNPNKILYYGLTVNFEYTPGIFSLIGIKTPFKASAFAKAFGGNFGPQPQQSDLLIPVYSHSGFTPPPPPNSISPQDIKNPPSQSLGFRLQPNYSRWPGDLWGLVDKRLHNPRQNNLNRTMIFLNKHRYYENTKRVYTIEDHLHFDSKDPLAHPKGKNSDWTRMMELMAIYPDLYDISYYSIMANYHQTYFEKVCKLLSGSNCDRKKATEFKPSKDLGLNAKMEYYIRGDFGWPESYKKLQNKTEQVAISIAPYSIKKAGYTSYKKFKIRQAQPITRISTLNWDGIEQDYTRRPQWRGINRNLDSKSNGSIPSLTGGNLFYPWLAFPLPDALLSSWTATNDPSNKKIYADKGYFDKDMNNWLYCEFPAKEKGPVPSACAGRGRTGYSVKMISCQAVKEFTKSDPPEGFEMACPP